MLKLSTRKTLLVASFVIVLISIVRYGYPLWQVRRANFAELKKPLLEMPALSSQDHILIIAPHCDDETLGCGGVIAEAVRLGVKVKVVMLTNGDGFYHA